jgi:hypothetical protein
MIGSAIDKTLAFCSCPAGIEAPHPPLDSEVAKPEAGRFHKGADYPAREIACSCRCETAARGSMPGR